MFCNMCLSSQMLKRHFSSVSLFFSNRITEINLTVCAIFANEPNTNFSCRCLLWKYMVPNIRYRYYTIVILYLSVDSILSRSSQAKNLFQNSHMSHSAIDILAPDLPEIARNGTSPPALPPSHLFRPNSAEASQRNTSSRSPSPSFPPVIRCHVVNPRDITSRSREGEPCDFLQ